MTVWMDILSMSSHDQTPDLPFARRPGLCPRCGTALRPLGSEVARVGTCHGCDPITLLAFDGEAISFVCPECQSLLFTPQSYGCRLAELNLAEVKWVYAGISSTSRLV